MSLKIIVQEEEQEHKQNIDNIFDKLKLQVTDLNKQIVKNIEQGELISNQAFIDRFGYKLFTSELSTGCKAALIIANTPNVILDTIECGENAVDVMINFVDKGTIIIQDRDITFVDYNNNKCDIELDGYKFTSIDRLNYYYFDERPYKPDLDIKGVEEIQ